MSPDILLSPHQSGSADMMAIDNLSSELSRDSSNMLMSCVIPRPLKKWRTTIYKATIALDGKLN